MSDFHPMKAPDYGMQGDAGTIRRPTGDVFQDLNKAPSYDKQGEPMSASARSVVSDFRESINNERERGRVPRETSGATSARSGSLSRSRSRGMGDVSMGFNPDSNFRGGASNGNADRRNASFSPTRAMGARSVSIERNNFRHKSRLDTLEGIGSSIDQGVANPEALDNGAAAAARVRNAQYDGPDLDADGEERQGRGRRDDSASGERTLSPHRAMGARSSSAVRSTSRGRAAAEDGEEERQGRQGRGTGGSSSSERVLSPHRAMGARSVSAARGSIPE